MGEGDSVLHYELPSGILLDTVVLDTDGKDLPDHGFDVTADRRIIVLGLYRVSSFDAATGALLARVTTENKPFGLRCGRHGHASASQPPVRPAIEPAPGDRSAAGSAAPTARAGCGVRPPALCPSRSSWTMTSK